jgi:hypothetical protein
MPCDCVAGAAAEEDEELLDDGLIDPQAAIAVAAQMPSHRRFIRTGLMEVSWV